MSFGDNIALVAGAVVALLLQVLVAPYVALFGAVPNVVAVYAALVAVTRPQRFGAVLPFVLGLAFDLAGGGPLGAMAFSLTLVSYGAARFCANAENGSPFVAIVTLALALFLVELLFGSLLLLFGYQADILGALAYRVIPCFVYDLCLGLVLYPLAARLFRHEGATLTNITQLR